MLGHEIEETITDPGAEDILGSGDKQTNLGGWYDTLDANENGDKCAWVGEPLVGGLPGQPTVTPIPGAMGDIKGNRGHDVRRPVAVEQRSRRGHRLLRGRGNRPADRLDQLGRTWTGPGRTLASGPS